MSNTATVTPYDANTNLEEGSSEVSAAIGAVIGGAIVGAVAILSEETDADREAVARLREQQRTERLQAAKPAQLALHISDTHSLILAAEKLGYKREAITSPAVDVKRTRPVLLRDSTGKQLVLLTKKKGTVVASLQGVSPIQALVRQHTLSTTKRFLEEKYKDVTAKSLANGDIEIQAREQATNEAGGQATITTQVRKDGRVEIDVDCVKGSRCEAIVNDYADAIGGKDTGTRKKEAFWELPGESTKTKVRI